MPINIEGGREYQLIIGIPVRRKVKKMNFKQSSIFFFVNFVRFVFQYQLKKDTTNSLKIAGLVWVSIVVIAVLTCTGCSSSGGSAGTGKTVKLTVWSTMGKMETEALEGVLKTFQERNPAIQVQMESIFFYQGKSKFESAAKAGVAPDVMRADRFWIPGFAKAGYIQELDQVALSEEMADLFPIAREAVNVDGKVYGLPHAIDCLALFYNKAHFLEAGVSPPDSFDQFRDTASKLSSGEKGRFGFFMNPDGWYFEPFLFGFGGKYFESGRLVIQSDQTLKAVHFLQDLKDTQHALPPVNLRTDTYKMMMQSFKSGQISMMMNGPWGIRDALSGTAFKDNVGNLGMAPLPKGPAGRFSPIGIQNWVISSTCKSRKEALTLIRFLCSSEVEGIISKKNFGLPARLSLFSDPELKKDPFLGPFLRQIQEGSALPDTSAERGELYGVISEFLVKVLNGDLSPEDAMKDLVSSWKGKK